MYRQCHDSHAILCFSNVETFGPRHKLNNKYPPRSLDVLERAYPNASFPSSMSHIKKSMSGATATSSQMTSATLQADLHGSLMPGISTPQSKLSMSSPLAFGAGDLMTEEDVATSHKQYNNKKHAVVQQVKADLRARRRRIEMQAKRDDPFHRLHRTPLAHVCVPIHADPTTSAYKRSTCCSRFLCLSLQFSFHAFLS